MNKRIKELDQQAVDYANNVCDANGIYKGKEYLTVVKEKFAELLVRECAEICLEMSAKCAGLEGDGALAKDCAYWIKKDFGVEE